MHTDLLLEIKENKELFEKIILEAIEENIYQYERYGVKFSLALGAINNAEIKMDSFGAMLRKTDKFIVVSKHVACAVYSFSDTKQGLKAASNLLNQFENYYFSEEIFLSVINVDDCSSSDKQIKKLFNVVEFAISQGMNNIPLDEISLES